MTGPPTTCVELSATVGDIHGNRAALDDILAQIRGEVAESDSIVFLGDYIDRGPDSRGCIDAILGFQREVSAEVICLLGNHEEWFLRTLRDYRRHSWLLGMEGFDTIRSYSVDAARVLRDAVSRAGAELILGDCALPYGCPIIGYFRVLDTRRAAPASNTRCTRRPLGLMDGRVIGARHQRSGMLTGVVSSKRSTNVAVDNTDPEATCQFFNS